MPHCLTQEQIEAIVSGDADPAIAAHARTCPQCAARIDEAREEHRFLSKVRVLAGAAMGPEGAPQIPGYRVTEIINRGAQGVVYRAVQESTSRPVAIKTLASGLNPSSRQRARAEREAEIAARLRHPNIVLVYESRTLRDGRIAVVMEYIDGLPLDEWGPPGDTPLERQRVLLRVFGSVCAAIHHAHLNGVTHRDLKPDNILVTAEGRPVVLDFGIAKAGGLNTTLTGEFAGTPAYASPEQVAGHPDDVDGLTDVYSLGVILYRLLCNGMPYSLDGSLFDVARTIKETEPVRPRERNPALSPDLEAIILRALQKDKPQRYQSAASLARDIERYLEGEAVDARSGSGWYMLRKAVAVNRGRLFWAALASALLLAAGLAVAFSIAEARDSARLAEFQREQARAEGVRARAITEILREILPGADPDHPEFSFIIAGGLSRLYTRLETGAYADDPEMDQALRRLWGGIYTDIGQGKAAGYVEYAEVALRTGLVRLRMEHPGDHLDTASALHALAGVLLVRQRAPEAEPIARDAIAMRTRILGESVLPTAESRALLARTLLALHRAPEAEREADAVIALAPSLHAQHSELLIASMIALKARSALDEERFDAAEPLLLESLKRLMAALPPDDPRVIVGLQDAAELARARPECTLASNLREAWSSTAESFQADFARDKPILAVADHGAYANFRQTGRTAALARYIRLHETLITPGSPGLVSAHFARIRSAEVESLFDERADSALRAAELLSDRFGPRNFSVLLCLDQASLAFAFSNRHDEAADMAQRACDIWDSIPESARDALFAANARRRLGWFLAVGGRYDRAADVLARAASELTAVVGPEHHVVALTEAMLALCDLERGRTAEADRLSQRAEELRSRSAAIAPDQAAHIGFIRGRVLVALGRHTEALAPLERAWNQYYHLHSPDYPWRRMLIADLAKATENSRGPEEAAKWRALLDPPGPHTQSP